MTEQVCPHCDRVITEKDIASYPKKLREKSLREEYKNSKIGRWHENIVVATIFLGLLVTFLTVVPFLIMDFETVKSYANTLLYLEIILSVVTICWAIYAFWIKLPNLENDYVTSRLTESAS